MTVEEKKITSSSGWAVTRRTLPGFAMGESVSLPTPPLPTSRIRAAAAESEHSAAAPQRCRRSCCMARCRQAVLRLCFCSSILKVMLLSDFNILQDRIPDPVPEQLLMLHAYACVDALLDLWQTHDGKTNRLGICECICNWPANYPTSVGHPYARHHQ